MSSSFGGQNVAGIILAAGRSSRFGEIKQLLPWREKNLLNTVIETAKLSGLNPLIVVLGADADLVRATIAEDSVKVVINRDWGMGQSTSLKAGLRAIRTQVQGAIFLLADQPQMSVNLVSCVVEEGLRTNKVIVPVIDDQRGNPVYFPEACFNQLDQLEGDVGGRQIISACPHSTLPWLDEWMSEDIDTPEDYQRLCAHFGIKP